VTCFSKQFLRKIRPVQLAFLPLLYVELTSPAVLYATLHFHFISPTDLLHPSQTRHIKTYHEFFIYDPNFTLLVMLYNLFSNLSKDFQQYAQYRTDKSETHTHSIHIRTPSGGGHYHHHGIHLVS